MNFFEKKKSLRGSVVLLSSLLLGSMTTSCVDSSFDFDKDFDWSINTGYLAFPVGKTDTIFLDDIIEIDEGDDLQIVPDADGNGVAGEYHLIKDGEIDRASANVRMATVDGSTTHIDPITAADESSVVSPSGMITTQISQTGDVKADAADIDDALKELGSLKAAAPTALTLNIKLEGNLNFSTISGNLKVKFPSFLVFNDPAVNANNEIQIPCSELQLNVPYVRTLQLTGYHFDGGLPVVNNEIHLNEQVVITGETNVQLPSGGQMGSGVKLQIVPTVLLADMSVDEATGIIQPEIDATKTSVEISNLPDFLNDDETSLSVSNPVILFSAVNPLNAPVDLTGKMLGKKEDGTLISGSEVKFGAGSTDPILLQPGSNLIALSRLGTGGPAGSQNIAVANINNLIAKIPDVVEVEMQPAVSYDKYYSIRLGHDYEVSGNYNIDIPLSFEEGLNIVYTDSADDLNSDLKDLDFEEAAVELDAVNTIPLELEVKAENVTPLDINKQPLSDIKVEVEGGIAASADGKTSTRQTLLIKMTEQVKGAMSRLDAIRFRVTAVPGQAIGITLRSDQWMQLENIKVKVPKGINIDLN
ncbi:putative uncharacterized protein [Prevotella sp. CAG:617]|nr:putative uncharacterized protein [Prevotella sp. CAG:617]